MLPIASGQTPEAPSVMGPSKDSLMDYTTVPVGWQIRGFLSTGHITKATILCPNCERVGLLAIRNSKRVIVHRGRASDQTLHAVEYCESPVVQH